MPVNRASQPRVVDGDLPAALAAEYAASSVLAWDIETSGLDWRSDVIGTCQLFAEGIGTVVVKVAGGDTPQHLVRLLGDPAVSKVFHHAPFDLRFMANAWGAQAASIRCTKVASKLLDPHGPTEAHSLKSLVARYLNVGLDKGAVRTSDWSASVLSAAQVAYAARDVLYLPQLLMALEESLTSRGLRKLYDRCCDFLPSRVALDLGEFPDVFAY